MFSFLFFACAFVYAQQSVYTHHAEYPFIVITADTVQQLPTFTDEEFYRTSQGVVFRVNRTEIPAGDQFMKLYRSEVLPWINSQHLQLRKVFIRGAASPEGSYQNNKRLGEGRAHTLVTELMRDLRHQYMDLDTEVSSVTEDYGYLCLLMREAGDPDYQLVQSIYDECQGDELCCKQRLMAARGRRLWSRLLRQYFPQLRAGRLVLWFSRPDEAHAPIPVGTIDSVDTQLPPVELQWPDVFVAQRMQRLPVDTTAMYQQRIPRRHVVAIRTNLLHDCFYMPRFGWAFSPNVQFEFYPWDGHLTYNIDMTWGTDRRWDEQKFWQMRDFQLEIRRYFRGGGRFMGLYMGAFAEVNVYGIGLGKKDGWEGEGAAAGLSLGYTMPLTRRKNLRLEFMLAAGYYYTRHDPYVYGNPVTGVENGKYYYNYRGSASAFKRRNHQLSWIGPTNAGIQLTYDILYRTRRKTIEKKGGAL